MIISRKLGYIFVHIPKTGGTALALALESRAKADDILIGDTPKALKRRGKVKGIATAGRLWKHSTLRDAEWLVTRADMKEMFTFTLVRNPWDRMVSYYHWLKTQDFNHPAVALAKLNSFSEFLNAPLTQTAFRANPYSSYMTDGAGQVHANLYIRLEHLQQDMRPLVDHLGFTPDIPYVNASVRPREWRGFYTQSDADLLGDICAIDIAAFVYGFDPA